MKICTILLFVLSGLLAACMKAGSITPQIPSETPKASVNTTKSISPTSTPQPSQTSIEILANTSTPTQSATGYCEKLLENYHPADGYRTYCDKDYGFAFDYPEGWRITFVGGSPDTSNPIEVLKAQRFEATDMSNYIRVDTFRNSDNKSLLNQVQSFYFYNDREFPNNDYPSLTLGGQRAYPIMNCWQQDYSAVYLFFQHGQFYTIMELKAISWDGIGVNRGIANSLQTPGSTPDKNVIPQEFIVNSNKLLECNAPPTPTPLTPLLPTWTVTPASANDLDLARHTLLTFFTLLHEGQYAEAVPLYGGSYDGMRNNNPVIPPDDYAALFESSCTNQRPCLLVANIVEEEKVSESEFKFLVEFVWIDGTLYKRGPCCGATETEMPPVWQFPYTVMKIDGQFKVMEEPVLMP
jgi:hypothetical protein